VTAGRPDDSASTGDLLPGARVVRTIGIVSPGAMGSALGRAWATAGARVVASVVGRTERTAGLATGLELLPDLDAVVAASDLVVSICPPAAAGAVLASVIEASRATGTTPLLLEANAVSPERVAALAAQAAAAASTSSTGPSAAGHPSPAATRCSTSRVLARQRWRASRPSVCGATWSATASARRRP
jgi:hypothetical protein